MAHATIAAPAAYAQIEEIIVTAERREALLQETDISMTVMDEQTLEEMGITGYESIGDFAPNVMTHKIPGKVGAAISMRGFKNAETIATFEPKVALYLDGVLIAKNAGSAFDVLDLQRIEILRGPQGTLYGRNTAGGAVNLITRKPHDEFEGNVTATLGKFSQRDIKAGINIPLADGLAFKANIASLNRDGYWDNDVLDRDEADQDRLVGHFQLQWRPSDDLSLLYSYDRTEADEKAWPLQLLDFNPVTHPQLAPHVGDGDSSERDLDWAGFQEADVDGHSLTINWDINPDLSLVSISALRNMETDGSTDADGSPEFVFANRSGDETETFTQEVRLVGSTGRLEYVAGAFYMDEDIVGVNNYNILPHPAGILESGLEASGNNEVWAVFGEGTYDLTSKLALTLGLRYTKEDRQMSRTDFIRIPAVGVVIPNELPQASGTFEDVSGTASLTYDWNEDLMTYLKFSKGYVSGGFNPRSPSPDTFEDGYEEEVVYTYELGWKSTWFDRALQLNGAIFYNDYQDLQVNLLDDATARNNIGNAGEAVIQGYEIEMQARPIANLDLGGGYGYLDPEYKSYIDPVSGEDLSNNDWAHAPTHSLNLFARYAIPEFQNLGDLSFRVDWSYRSKHSLLTQPGNSVPGYDFVNARMTLDNIRGPGDTAFRVAFWGKNLTDELWYTSGYNLVSLLGFRAAATNAPRTYGADLEFRF